MINLRWRIAAPVLLFALVVCLGWGFSVEVQKERAAQPVIHALTVSSVPALQQALAQGGDPNATDVFGSSPPNSIWEWVQRSLWPHRPIGGVTALTLAAETQQDAAVQLLLAHGAKPSAPNSDGLTPLMEICRQPSAQYYTASSANATPVRDTAEENRQASERRNVVNLLCQYGSDVNAKYRDGVTPLIAAAQSHQPLLVRALLDHGAAVNAAGQDGQTALSAAVQSDTPDEEAETIETLQVLLDHGADVNERTPNGGSLLQQASEWIDKPVVLLLLQHGANPNVQSPANKMTTLMQAARQGQYEVAKVALDKGADANVFVEDEGSALFLALEGGHKDIVRLLLDRGADPDLGYSYGVTPLMVAAAAHDTPTVSLLLAHGANVNQTDPHGDTALQNDARSELEGDYVRHHRYYDASDIGHWVMAWPKGKPVPTATAALLLAHGADVNASDQWGNTALSLAQASGKTALVALLRARGATLPWWRTKTR